MQLSTAVHAGLKNKGFQFIQLKIVSVTDKSIISFG